MGKLTPKQKRFCDEYLVDLNATQAAIRAGYSKKTARQIGEQNLSKLVIRSYIDARMAEKESSLIASQEDVLKTLSNILSGDEMGTVLRGVGKGAQVIDQAPPSNADKIRAAEILGKYYKLFTDRQEVEVKGAVQFIDDIGGDDG